MNRHATAETAQAKGILGVFQPGSTHMVGDGFPVRNLFPSNDLDRDVSPFLMLDYAGPQYFSPTDHPRGVGEHPHRGFETVTIVYEGMVAHRDSAGNAGVIGPGDVQWMTAASGILHEEFHEKEFARKGGTLHPIQLWVNLPRESKMSAPGYQTILNADIPAIGPCSMTASSLKACRSGCPKVFSTKCGVSVIKRAVMWPIACTSNPMSDRKRGVKREPER